ncbi:hypothetical protein MHTCC0001_29700 [Flavobacteriaceae bacterium MHTCC 0001]
MKSPIINTLLFIFSICTFVSCSKDDDTTPVAPGITLYEKQGTWDCDLGNTCEDVYQFEFKKNSKISISIEGLTGKSVVSIDLSADFGQYGGPNLLNEGNLSYYGCTGQNEEVNIANIQIDETSTYNLFIARDWGLSAGGEGTYTLVVISDTPFTESMAPTHNANAVNYERECLQ